MLVSEELNISKATVQNWIRSGVILSNELSKPEIESLKQQLKDGSLKKLVSRANKNHSKKTFIPQEYVVNKQNVKAIAFFANRINHILSDCSINEKMYLTSLLYIRQLNYVELSFSLKELAGFVSKKKDNNQLFTELFEWQKNINFNFLSKFDELKELFVPVDEFDFLGIVYQTLKTEGEKSKTGSYYTPYDVVQNIVKQYVKDNFDVLDPACGTGQFLLHFAEKIKNPNHIYGYDTDPIAVRIARINLIIKYRKIDFVPKIFCVDTLQLSRYFKKQKKFDFIATNPPWGSSFSHKKKKILSEKFPEIKSYEIFSYFLIVSLQMLKKNGILSFILPSSFLNVAVHKDIREILIKETTILKVFEFEKLFKNVFTNVIEIDIKNAKSHKNIIKIYNNRNLQHKINQREYIDNKDSVFLTKITPKELELIKKVYSFPHFLLKNNAVFGLGIVTGNNKKFVFSQKQSQTEPVYKGRDIEKYFLKEASSFIKFEHQKLQQVAPINKYRAKEKLIYRFISKDLIFAYDNGQNLTLNSANILIPTLENYSIKIILGLLNSKLYNFLFQKKFNSIKVLRSHIESLPIPKLSKNQKDKIENLVENILSKKIVSDELDNYICKVFELTDEEKNIILV